MAISVGSTLDDRDRSYRLVFERYDECRKRGFVCRQGSREEYEFDDFREMIWVLESCFEQVKYPREVLARRSLHRRRNTRPKKTLEPRNAGESAAGQTAEADAGIPGIPGIPGTHGVSGRLPFAFTLRVTQRQNATWQGNIREEGNPENGMYRFFSFYELLCYLDEHLGYEAAEGKDADLEETGQEEIEPEELGPEAAGQEEIGQRDLEHGIRLVMDDHESSVILPDVQRYLFRDGDKTITFLVRPMFRKNNTCQGKVYWKEWRKEGAFRSFLELVHMMNEVLTDEQSWSAEDPLT